MGLISASIPNLVNGVSQQPDALRLASQGEAQVNAYSSVVEGLKRRPPTEHVAKIVDGQLGKAYCHLINRDMAERYIVLMTGGDIKVFNIDGTPREVRFPDGTDYLTTETPEQSFRSITIADYTFLVNTEVTVQMKESTTPDRGVEAIVFIKQASHETDYTIELEKGADKIEAKHSTGDTGKVSTQGIADALKTAILDANLGYEVEVGHSTLWIRQADGSDFSVKASDSRSNTHIKMAKDTVQKFSDLPTVAPRDFTVEVIGDSSSSFDNYYVKFQPNNETADFDAGQWIETVKPGLPWEFDATTMPHALVREADGQFSFKKLDWAKRECGDDESAPEPTFVGKTLNDIFFYRNRLGFLADENIIMSEAAEYFNFWPTTVTTLVDSDPIDTAASHTKVSILHHAIPFNEELLLFSDQTQFTLEAEDILSNSTVAAKPMTEFECSLKAKPVGAGKNVFFAVNKGNYSGIREYYVDGQSQEKDAADITSHVPQYIPGGLYKLAVSTNEDILLGLTEKEQNSIYVYKYFWSGMDKLQSAWSKWTFDGTILNCDFIDSECYMIMQYADGVYVERMYIEPGRVDPGAPFEFLLDRKVADDKCTVIYDEASNKTKYELPYTIDPTNEMRVVTRYGQSTVAPGADLKIVGQGDNWVEVFGDYTLAPVYLGCTYETSYTFSTQVMKEEASGGGQAVIGEGRLQMRHWAINYADTGYFKVEVTPLYRDTNTYTFTGRVTGAGSNVLGEIPISSGTFKFPVMSKNDQVKIELKSDSFLPCHFISGEWEALYTIRSRRL